MATETYTPGAFANTEVLITETFTAADGTTVYATEDYVICAYEDLNGPLGYEAYEWGKDWFIRVTDEELHGRAQIIAHR